jgi:DNA-binding transcriptional LysR family regulator
MSLDPKSLQLFVSVAEEGTIAAAAVREHIAPAAVSRRLSELEEELHTVLFVRSNKGLELTRSGISLLNMARRILHDMHDIYIRMQEHTTGPRGFVRVVANISCITQFLPAQLSSFLSTYPNIQVGIEERISNVVTKSVHESIADIGLFTLGAPAQDLEVFPYQKDELVVIVPEEHALAGEERVRMSELLPYDFVGLHTGSAINFQLMKIANDLGKTMKLRIQVTGFDALCLMVEAGLGVGILPRNAAKTYQRTLRIKIVTLNEVWAHRELAICVRSREHLSDAARLLIDHLRSSTVEQTTLHPDSQSLQRSQAALESS